MTLTVIIPEAETTTRPAEGQGQRGSTGGAGHVNAGIIGATVGGFILVGVVILIILLIRRRKPKRGYDNTLNWGVLLVNKLLTTLKHINCSFRDP